MPTEDPVSLEWMRTRPASVQALMRRFPPACHVRAIRPLLCPAAGETAQVCSYWEDGRVGVAHPGQPRHLCQPEWLEVVGYHDGQDEAWVAAVLDEATSP